MAPINGAIGLKLNICNAYTTDVNISKAQPSKACGLGGVASQRAKSATILYKYKLTAPAHVALSRNLDIFSKKIFRFLPFNFHCKPQSLKTSKDVSGVL